MNELESRLSELLLANGYALYDAEILKENDTQIFRVSITRLGDFVGESGGANGENAVNGANGESEGANLGEAANPKSAANPNAKKAPKNQKSPAKNLPAKKPITLDDCAFVDGVISPLLDVYPPIEGGYSLEVSSPGLERKLKTPRHFMLSVGENICLTLSDKTTLTGRLTAADEGGFSLDSRRFRYSEIRKAKTTFEW